MRTIFAAILLLSSLAWGGVFRAEGNKIVFSSESFSLADLATTFGEYRHMNVVFTPDFKDANIIMRGTRELAADSLELYISAMLAESNYSYRTIPSTNTLLLFPSRDVRYANVGSFTDLSKVPNTYEYVQFAFQLRHMEAKDLARNMRPFVGRYGRIIDHTNQILLSDHGKNIHRIMALIKVLDTPEYKAHEQEVKDINERNKQTVVKKKPLLTVLSDNNVIFLVLFSLIGAVIGFGVRGYAMRRIEGGW